MVQPLIFSPISSAFPTPSVFKRNPPTETGPSFDLIIGGNIGGSGISNSQPLATPASSNGLLALLTLLSRLLSGQQMTTSTPTPVQSSPTAGLMTDTQVSSALNQSINGGTAQSRVALKNTLMAIAQDPEGRRLLETSLRNGTTFEVGNPALQVNAPGENVLGVTTTQNGLSHVIVSDANNVKTIVHELVHAATSQDNDSIQEEATANIIGKRVAARIAQRLNINPGFLGFSGSQTATGTIAETVPNYVGLNRTNAIANTLAQLGINVGINVSQFV